MMVIFIHVSATPVTNLDPSSGQYLLVMIPWRLAGFVVQGFIFLSGLKLLMSKANSFAYGQLLLNRLSVVILPYVVWVLIYYIFFVWKSYLQFDLTALLHYIFVGDLVGHLYFVIVIAQFYILAPVWIKLVKNTSAAVLILIALVVTIISSQNFPDIVKFFSPGSNFLYTDRIFLTYLVYWIAGCYAGLYYERFKEILRNNRVYITIFFIIAATGNLLFSYFEYNGMGKISRLDDLHLVYCLSAILFFFVVALLITDNNFPQPGSLVTRLINNLDRTSYGVYLAHCLPIFIVDGFLLSTNFSISECYLIRFLTVYAVAISGALLWRYLRDGQGSGNIRLGDNEEKDSSLRSE